MVDQMVLEAQRWVNRTYSAIPGYQPVKETGVTGWSTMYSLIMGLQHELGIKNLAASFGPKTQSLFTESGGLNVNDNNNKVKIAQAALYCKGYSPGGITGRYGPGTATALAKLSSDIGISNKKEVLSVSTKLMQALLTMDAYKLLAGGRSTVQQFQQYLNRTYGSRKNFVYGPCDGLFSRNTQKALVMALQLEMGIEDDLATGFFGPATRAGLQKIGLGLSAWSKPAYIPLFTGALDANGYGRFSLEKYDGLEKDIISFQKNSELPLSSIPDYSTWCELLVSMGNPNRKVDTVDTRFEITAKWAKYLKSIGIKYIARYLDEYNPDPDQNKWFKQLRPEEPQRIIDHGMNLLLFSQLTTGSSESVLGDRGYNHAVKTQASAERLGIPSGSTIYFAIDFDATDADIDNLVIPYFRLVSNYMSQQVPRYAVGVYGTRNVCKRVVAEQLAVRSFISGISYGWSGNLGFSLPDSWAFNQIDTRYPEGTSDGFAYDAVVRKTTGIFIDEGVNKLDKKPSDANESFFSYVDDVYDVINELRISNPEHMLLNYMRIHQYSGIHWEILLGVEPTDKFSSITNELIRLHGDKYKIDENEEGIKCVIPPNIFDYRSGVFIDPQHLAAVAVGAYKRILDSESMLMVFAGEYTGWAGDLVTLFGEYNYNENAYADPRLFVNEYFGNYSNSSFKYQDLIEDSLGFLAAVTLAKGSNTVRGMFKEKLSTEYSLNPISEFFDIRFGGSVEYLESQIIRYLGEIFVNPINRSLAAVLSVLFDLPPFNPDSEWKMKKFANQLARRFAEIAQSK